MEEGKQDSDEDAPTHIPVPYNEGLLLFLLVGASIVEVIAVSHHVDDLNTYNISSPETDWVLACACISLFISAVLGIFYKIKPEQSEPAVAIGGAFLAFWWTFGMFVATFVTPFQVAGNGYIAAWVAFIAAFALAFKMARFMRPAPLANVWLALSHAAAHGGSRLNLAGGGGLRIVVAASFVETFQAIMACDQSLDCTKYYAGAMVFGVVSLFVVLVFVGCYEKLARFRSPVALFLMTWWAVGAVLLTDYFPPFEHVGNGFLSCWMAFGGSVWFASTAGFSGAAAFAHMQKALERPVADDADGGDAAAAPPPKSEGKPVGKSEDSAVV